MSAAPVTAPSLLSIVVQDSNSDNDESLIERAYNAEVSEVAKYIFGISVIKPIGKFIDVFVRVFDADFMGLAYNITFQQSPKTFYCICMFPTIHITDRVVYIQSRQY